MKMYEEQYKAELMKDYGVTRDLPNTNGLICPTCNVFADENNVCPKCKRKL